MLELPKAAHGPHLLQVSVEGQPAQAKAVAAIADRLQTLHLLHDWRHRYWRRDGRRRQSAVLLAGGRLAAQGLLV